MNALRGTNFVGRVKEPDVVTDKNCFGELYEKWIEMRSVYKCLTLILLILFVSLLIILALHIADENFFTFRDPGPEQYARKNDGRWWI